MRGLLNRRSCNTDVYEIPIALNPISRGHASQIPDGDPYDPAKHRDKDKSFAEAEKLTFYSISLIGTRSCRLIGLAD